MFLFTNPLWKICMKYLHVSLWLDDSHTEFAAQFGEAFSHKTMKNNKYLCQKYFTQLFGTTKTFMLFKKQAYKQENCNDMHADIGFSRKSNCFCLVVREKAGYEWLQISRQR